MAPMVLGWILIGIGLIATIAGIGGGIVRMMKDLSERGTAKGFAAPPTDLIKALKDLLEALIKAPVWLALVILGFILIAWGGAYLR
jgi:hypothetical protein